MHVVIAWDFHVLEPLGERGMCREATWRQAPRARGALAATDPQLCQPWSSRHPPPPQALEGESPKNPVVLGHSELRLES